jgi:hypothetical protein
MGDMTMVRREVCCWPLLGVLLLGCGSSGGDGEDNRGSTGADAGASGTGEEGTGGNPSAGSGSGGIRDAGTHAAGAPETGGSVTGGNAAGGSATGGTSSSDVDLCDGLVTDKKAHPMTALSKPALGEAVTDPEFRTTLRRITDVGGTGVIKPMYSPTQAWNADETYMVLYEVGHGHLLYDGQTYEVVRDLDIDPPDLEQVYWSTVDPDALFWIDGNELMRYRVSTARSEAVHAIDCSGQVRADSHAWISWDSQRLGLYCESSGTAFIYDLSAGETLGLAESDEVAPFISASGTLAYLDGDVVDTSMKVLRTLDLAYAGEHCSLGRLASGHDTYNLVQFDSGPRGSGVGSLVTFDMTDGSSRVIVGPDTGYPYPPSGTHLSAPIYKRPGWVFLSIIGDESGSDVLDQELVLADTNPGGRVCRIAHHRSQEAQDYWGEPHVTGSPSGTRAIFGSDWGGGQSVDTYVVELPAFGG